MQINSTEDHTITIEKLVYEGWGMGRIGTLVVFVPNTLPGDKVRITAPYKKRNHAMGKVSHYIENSPYRLSQSPCTHYPDCGGCQTIDVSYTQQLTLKTQILQDCIRKFYPELSTHLQAIIPAEQSTFYRNKMDYAFKKDTPQSIRLGLKKRGQFDQIIATPDCQLQSLASNRIRHHLEHLLQNSPLSVWDPHQRQGTLRYLTIRHAHTTNEIMLNFTVSDDIQTELLPLISELIKETPAITSVYMTQNPNLSDNAANNILTHLAGEKHIHERFENRITYRISPQSFFQTNSLQAQVLYQHIRRIAELKPTDTLLDLYCGTGTIGLFLADQVQKVIGIEEIPQAIEDAKYNAKNNGITNINFYAEDVKNLLKYPPFPTPDAIITDPPRAGMTPKALKRMAALNAAKLIYVSCNPVTLMRDLKTLSEMGYTVHEICPVDMFPNTFHVECVVKLTRRIL